MTDTTFNVNLCIGTTYEELSDKNKREYKPEHWAFVDTFPENITEVKGNIAIFNQLPTFPQDLKIAGPVAFHNIEFKETDILPFKKSATCMDFSNCYGTLDIGGIDICSHLIIGGGADEKLNILVSEQVKSGTCMGFDAHNLSYTLKDLTVKDFIMCNIRGLKKVYDTVPINKCQFWVGPGYTDDADFHYVTSGIDNIKFDNIYELYEMFPHLVPEEDKELWNKYGMDTIKYSGDIENVETKYLHIILGKVNTINDDTVKADYCLFYDEHQNLLDAWHTQEGIDILRVSQYHNLLVPKKHYW